MHAQAQHVTDLASSLPLPSDAFLDLSESPPHRAQTMAHAGNAEWAAGGKDYSFEPNDMTLNPTTEWSFVGGSFRGT